MMYVIKDIFYLIFSGFLTWFFLKISINFLKKHLVDFPNNRSSHKSPKPTAGGISFLFSISLISIFKGIYVPLFAIPLAFIGFIDDKWGVKPWIRLTAQIITVTIYFYIFLLDIIKLNFDNHIIFIFLSFFLIFCGIAIINFINFMDGIDGLVSSCLAFIFFVFFIKTGSYYLPFVGSLLIFTKWNWQPSKIFMGDVGSTFLGACVTGMLFSIQDLYLSIATLLLFTPIMLDSSWCIIRRKLNNENIVKPHKKHLFQRLTMNKFSHSDTSIIYFLGTFLISIPYLFGNLLMTFSTACFVGLIGIYIDKKYAIPFNKC